MLRKKIGEAAKSPRLSSSLKQMTMGAVDRRTFLKKSGLTVGGIGGLILAMISRVSLGHTGRPLTPPKSMTIAYVLISLAALVRAVGPWAVPEKTLLFIDISGGFWIIAFVIFIVGYGPMLINARKDLKEGVFLTSS